MNQFELRNDILISIQRALLGMIYPSIRAIAVGFQGNKKLIVTYYLDRAPNQGDYENIAIVTTEVFADINFTEVEENCVFSNEPLQKLDKLECWVYARME